MYYFTHTFRLLPKSRHVEPQIFNSLQQYAMHSFVVWVHLNCTWEQNSIFLHIVWSWVSNMFNSFSFHLLYLLYKCIGVNGVQKIEWNIKMHTYKIKITVPRTPVTSLTSQKAVSLINRKRKLLYTKCLRLYFTE